MSGAAGPRFEAELRRGVVQLVALHYLEERRYGYDLVRLLAEAGFRIEEGTLYPILRRFEKQGVLTSEWDTSGARPRKYYVLSDEGRRLRTHMRQAWLAARDATDTALGAMRPDSPGGTEGLGSEETRQDDALHSNGPADKHRAAADEASRPATEDAP